MAKPRIIRETKCTCKSCSNVWHYGKADSAENIGNAMNNCGNSLMCCGGCIPALWLHDKPVKDLNKCPKCGSRAITKEIVAHEV